MDCSGRIRGVRFGRSKRTTRRLLLTDRNARWAEWVEKRLEQPGTVFMAVGAGHLAGKDSVQDFLAKRNVKVKRIQY